MDKPNSDAAGPDEMFNRAEMEARIERMKCEGRLPSLEQFLAAIATLREEWQDFVANNAEAVPAYSAKGESKTVSISDFETVRDELRDILAPGGYRAAITRLTGKNPLVPIRSARPNSRMSDMEENDLTVGDQGTIFTFTPHTKAGSRFLHEDLETEGWQWLGETLCVDHRLAPVVMDGAINEGITFSIRE